MTNKSTKELAKKMYKEIFPILLCRYSPVIQKCLIVLWRWQKKYRQEK